jgi:hypothetical protein
MVDILHVRIVVDQNLIKIKAKITTTNFRGYMKTRLYSFLLLTLSIFLAACGSAPKADSSSQSTINLFYTDDGGKGISLAILAPEASGLTENQGYIPALVQGEFVSNFSGYSTISVLDRVQLDSQYAELLSGYYEENADAGRDLGHLTPTEYIMGGKIIKTTTGYALQIQITKTADKMTAASYSGTCTFAELDNLTGIRRASLDLLQKMGIEPTERTKTELAGAAAANHVNAQTALARGITAQRTGDDFSAMSSYFDARTFDANLSEAASRMASVSTMRSFSVESGSGLRGQVMSEIQRQREAIRLEKERKEALTALLKKANAFYKARQPFEVKIGDSFSIENINQAKATADIAFAINLMPVSEDFTVIRQLSGNAQSVADLDAWPFKYHYFYLSGKGPVGYEPPPPPRKNYPGFHLWKANLRRVRGRWSWRELGGETATLNRAAVEALNRAGEWQDARMYGSEWPDSLSFMNESSHTVIPNSFFVEQEFKPAIEVANENGKVLKRIRVSLNAEILVRGFQVSGDSQSVTFTVPVDDITDNMAVRIVSVNGKSPASGYVKIVQPIKILVGR